MDRFPLLRPLTETERELSEHLIRGALPSPGELIEQLNYAQARGVPPFVEFEVAPTAPRPKGISKGLLEGTNPDSESTTWTHVLLWIEEGCISALEVSWVSDDEPKEFPSPAEVEIVPPSPADPGRAAADARERRLVTWPMLIVGTIGAISGLSGAIILVESVPLLQGLDGRSGSRVTGGLAFFGAVAGAMAGRRLVLLFRR